ncbi:hypothetical protein TrRE_jg10846 [Triparma retinervis]|uniref:MBD domain-containing protein n=1 Tax=Triparma retinervis TaxID=2557542 RepID=A0A9W7A5H4_9STRA|nr:hypothetical protein TrRE_jg10846 [Triparma retinervis]
MVFWEQLVNHVSSELRKSAEDPLAMNAVQAHDQANAILEGWSISIRHRKSGATGGSVDAYYHSPIDGKRYRSRLEVIRALCISSSPTPLSSGPPNTPSAAWALARKNLRSVARTLPVKASGVWIRSLPQGPSVHGPGLDCFRYEWHGGKVRRFRTFTTEAPEEEGGKTIYNVEWGPRVDAMDEDYVCSTRWYFFPLPPR